MLQNVKGVGQKGAIADVSDGFALNALIPQGKAIQATADRVAQFQKRLREREAEQARSNAELAKLLLAINGKKVIIKTRANDKGHLFRSITPKDIAAEIARQLKAPVEERMLMNSDQSIKEIGERSITISAAGAKATVVLIIEAA